MKTSKRYEALIKKYNPQETYSLKEGVEILKNLGSCKFDESVEIHIKLNVDPKKTDQLIRGAVELPYGTGKKVRILAITTGENVKKAEEAGADYVGGDDVIEKIKQGWLDFDVVVATPDMMPKLGQIGKILGPRGLMPSPKSGTVSQDIAGAIKSLKKGKVTYKTDKTGVIHSAIGKVSFSTEQIYENAKEFIKEIFRSRPQNVKGEFVKSVYLATTMSPSVKLDVNELRNIR
uniref:Large ribosomal subunit protein uL1 n=1 Tax=candidate division WOR-3 bacterium TaxID=2052148 RepID=A0A7C4Y4Q8_UNCW3